MSWPSVTAKADGEAGDSRAEASPWLNYSIISNKDDFNVQISSSTAQVAVMSLPENLCHMFHLALGVLGS
ncbi:hypothetical protein FRX31_005496, partial [Thalictrum thalictroides]